MDLNNHMLACNCELTIHHVLLLCPNFKSVYSFIILQVFLLNQNKPTLNTKALFTHTWHQAYHNWLQGNSFNSFCFVQRCSFVYTKSFSLNPRSEIKFFRFTCDRKDKELFAQNHSQLRFAVNHGLLDISYVVFHVCFLCLFSLKQIFGQ